MIDRRNHCVLHSHMTHVEQTGLLTGPVVRLDDAQVTILHRHVVAAKGYKLGAILAVQLIQTCPRRLLPWRLRRGVANELLLLLLLLAGTELAGRYRRASCASRSILQPLSSVEAQCAWPKGIGSRLQLCNDSFRGHFEGV